MPQPSSILTVVLLLAATPKAAWPAAVATQQEPAPSPAPAESGPASPAASAPPASEGPTPPAPSEPPSEPGDIRVKAESYAQVEKGHMEARGTVELHLGDIRILADQADVYEIPQPDGTVRRRVVALGNVVFIRGEERLAGERAEMDDTGHGFFENALGYVEPGVFIEARRVERVDADTYKVQDARFTSCSQPNPRWKFSARSARIEVNDKIVASSALLRIKGVPAFYLPWFYYPIRQDGRSTGFLMPSFGYSARRGFNLNTGFFWAMGRSVDQTFYADYWSDLGQGLGHELRYQLVAPSRGRYRSYVFFLDPEGTRDYDLDWNAMQVLPGRTRANLVVRKTSNLLFRQRFSENFAVATSRSERISGGLDRDLGFATLNAYVDATSTYYGSDFSNVSERLPGISLRRYPRQIGAGGIVFGLLASADRIRYGNQERVDEWSRYDVFPTLSRPFSLSFLEFNPSVGYRFTRYGATIATNTIEDADDGTVRDVAMINGPAQNRSFLEAALEMRGPTFARVFDTPGAPYSSRFKHTIGPEISWQYRTRVEDANEIPKFSGEDYLYGTNQVQYSLVQRFYAKRPGPTGKAVPWSFFEWRLGQTYYVQISEGQNAYDPNYSSSAYGPGSQPEHLSPLQSRMRLRPRQDVSLDYNLEYDVNFEQLRRMALSGNVSASRLALRGSWTRAVRLSVDADARTVTSHTLRGEAVLDLLPRRLSLEGSVDYDLKQDLLYHLRAQARYAVQCCAVSVEHVRYNWNSAVDTSWRFNVELAGMSAIGSFMGAGPGGQSGLGAYR